ncbi:MAG: L-threonylcarbamoyladenylate synthase [Clostridiales bacterium]|nr:L-threonylcarbamoyladenylate synthase [Clostridiales bacterium]
MIFNMARTEILDVRVPGEETTARLGRAAEVIKRGGLVAFPTETVYGLGANAFDEEAVGRIYEAKGRPSDNPMIAHIARPDDIGLLAKSTSPHMEKLAKAFWPGPLTMVAAKRDEVPRRVTGGLETVAIRLPDHPVAAELIRLAGIPLAAPSANLSGSPSPTKAEHVIADLDGKVDIILQGGPCHIGIESTVVDMTASPPCVLRPGIITREDIETCLGEPIAGHSVITTNPQAAAPFDAAPPKSPGMKYAHYAPKATLLVVMGQDAEKTAAELMRLKKQNEALGIRVGLLLAGERSHYEFARDFYAKLRDFDNEGVDMIIAVAPPEVGGITTAILNRLLKAAGNNIVRV